MLVGDIEARLKELIEQTCIEIKVDIIEMEIKPDHVHLLIEVDPQYGIHKAIYRKSKEIRKVVNT